LPPHGKALLETAMLFFFYKVATVSGLAKVAGLGAQNCQNTTKVDARWNVQLTIPHDLEPNLCASCKTHEAHIAQNGMYKIRGYL
jgi:hypothetical protein